MCCGFDNSYWENEDGKLSKDESFVVEAGKAYRSKTLPYLIRIVTQVSSDFVWYIVVDLRKRTYQNRTGCSMTVFVEITNPQPLVLSPLAYTAQLHRSTDYWEMSSQDQWAEDKRLGLLDWDGSYFI